MRNLEVQRVQNADKLAYEIFVHKALYLALPRVIPEYI